MNLDVSWGMFQVRPPLLPLILSTNLCGGWGGDGACRGQAGLAITDALFAQLEGVGSAPPFHSHLRQREHQHSLRYSQPRTFLPAFVLTLRAWCDQRTDCRPLRPVPWYPRLPLPSQARH